MANKAKRVKRQGQEAQNKTALAKVGKAVAEKEEKPMGVVSVLVEGDPWILALNYTEDSDNYPTFLGADGRLTENLRSHEGRKRLTKKMFKTKVGKLAFCDYQIAIMQQRKRDLASTGRGVMTKEKLAKAILKETAKLAALVAKQKALG